jgi:hypothetical protein
VPAEVSSARKHLVGFGFGLLAVFSASASAAKEEFGREVQLPPFIVEDQGSALHWRFAAISHLQILSLCSDDTTEEFARQTYRMDQQLDWILSGKTNAS